MGQFGEYFVTTMTQSRIYGVLLLFGPMTVRQIARCLSLASTTVRTILHGLYARCKVTRYRTQTRSSHYGTPPYVYELRA